MKKIFGLLVLILACMFSFAAYAEEDGVSIDEEHFPDPVFREAVKQYDLNNDGILSPDEADGAVEIRVNGEGVVSLHGIEYLTGLEDLYCFNNNLTELDLSRNKMLHFLNCAYNNLTELNVSQNPHLVFLHCDSNRLSTLDVSRNPKLQMLSCFDTQIKELDISNLTELAYLLVFDCELTKLDISNNPDLMKLDCSGNRLTKLDLSNNPFMLKLSCDENSLTELDISNCANLLALVETVKPRDETERLIWEKESYPPKASSYYNDLLVIDKKVKLFAEEDPDPGVPIDAQHFPSEVFREEVKQYDLNGNGFLSSKEANIATHIYLSEKNISSLAGIEYLTGLRKLYCDQNNLTELDLSSNIKLKTLFCNFNQLTKLNLSGNSELKMLVCDHNQLRELDISYCPILLDLVTNHQIEDSSTSLFWINEQYINGKGYLDGTLLIDKNVRLYSGTGSTP